jgi:putative oxidoreductase
MDVMELNVGLLVVRLVIGLAMAAHGAQKLFGWFGGIGLAGTGQFFDAIGFRPGRVMAVLAGLSEFVGGLVVAFGLLGPVGPALMVAVMLTAAGSVHWSNGFFAMVNGIEVPLLYGATAVGLALTGPGVYSLDALFGVTRFWTPELIVAAIAVGVLGGIVNLGARSLATHAVVSA